MKLITQITILLSLVLLCGCSFRGNLGASVTDSSKTSSASDSGSSEEGPEGEATRITAYCEEQLGSDWEKLEYEPEEADYKEKPYNEIVDEYHADINELFDEPTQKMVKVVEAESSLEEVCTNTSISKKIKKPISAYEISQKAFCRYARYHAVLKAKSQNITQKNIDDVDVRELLEYPHDAIQSDYYNALKSYRESVESELKIARMSLEQALMVYDEMMLTYPLHLRLRCITADLLTFRTKLAELVNVFFCMDRYINAASDRMD